MINETLSISTLTFTKIIIQFSNQQNLINFKRLSLVCACTSSIKKHKNVIPPNEFHYYLLIFRWCKMHFFDLVIRVILRLLNYFANHLVQFFFIQVFDKQSERVRLCCVGDTTANFILIKLCSLESKFLTSKNQFQIKEHRTMTL